MILPELMKFYPGSGRQLPIESQVDRRIAIFKGHGQSMWWIVLPTTSEKSVDDDQARDGHQNSSRHDASPLRQIHSVVQAMASTALARFSGLADGSISQSRRPGTPMPAFSPTNSGTPPVAAIN